MFTGSLLSCCCSANFLRRATFSCFVSGRYLINKLNNSVAWFLFKVFLNWLTLGGTFNLCNKTFFCLCKRIYLGHLTKRVKSLPLGKTSLPILKFFGRAGNKGSVFLTGATVSTFFVVLETGLDVFLGDFAAGLDCCLFPTGLAACLVDDDLVPAGLSVA